MEMVKAERRIDKVVDRMLARTGANQLPMANPSDCGKKVFIK